MSRSSKGGNVFSKGEDQQIVGNPYNKHCAERDSLRSGALTIDAKFQCNDI
jgi:hypothetical protein